MTINRRQFLGALSSMPFLMQLELVDEATGASPLISLYNILAENHVCIQSGIGSGKKSNFLFVTEPIPSPSKYGYISILGVDDLKTRITANPFAYTGFLVTYGQALYAETISSSNLSPIVSKFYNDVKEGNVRAELKKIVDNKYRHLIDKLFKISFPYNDERTDLIVDERRLNQLPYHLYHSRRMRVDTFAFRPTQDGLEVFYRRPDKDYKHGLEFGNLLGLHDGNLTSMIIPQGSKSFVEVERLIEEDLKTLDEIAMLERELS